MTFEDEKDFQTSKKRWICERQYKPDEGENIPVRDHCHMTGKYRGSAHKTCNLCILFLKLKYKISIIYMGAALAELCLLGNKTQHSQVGCIGHGCGRLF